MNKNPNLTNFDLEVFKLYLLEMKRDEALSFILERTNRFNNFIFMSILCEKGEIDLIKILIEKHNFDPFQTDKFKNSYLLHAAKTGQNDVISLFIEKYKLNPNFKNESWYTCLDVACSRGHLSTINLLITKYKARYSLQDICREGFTSAFKYLIDEMKVHNLPELINTAILNSRLSIVKYLMEEKKCDVENIEESYFKYANNEIKNYLEKFIKIKKPIKEKIFSLEKILCENEVDCSICLEKLKGTPCYKVECNHHFHTHCLIEWVFKDNKNCPLCRKELN